MFKKERAGKEMLGQEMFDAQGRGVFGRY